MTDEISLGEKRNILLPFIILIMVYVLLKVFSIKVSLWILVIVAIVAILFIALSSYRLKSSAPSTTEETEPTVPAKKSTLWDYLKTFLAGCMIITGVIILWLVCLGTWS